MLSAIAIVVLVLLLLLAPAALKPRRGDNEVVVERIEACLPQTQCGQCLYAGCRPYAEAVAAGSADINQCPPGGQDTINALARLLGRSRKRLNPLHGQEAAARVAFIREDLCIGCKLCIKACPVDAILGSAKSMHTVITTECTGCDLCVEPCPVDCIDMLDAPSSARTWRSPVPLPVAARG